MISLIKKVNCRREGRRNGKQPPRVFKNSSAQQMPLTPLSSIGLLRTCASKRQSISLSEQKPPPDIANVAAKVF
jgi:hypothetical protein